MRLIRDYIRHCIGICVVRSGVGANVGEALRRVHLATKLLRSQSDHRQGRRQARHARILQIVLHLTQPRSTRSAPRHVPPPLITTKQKPMGGILRRHIHVWTCRDKKRHRLDIRLKKLSIALKCTLLPIYHSLRGKTVGSCAQNSPFIHFLSFLWVHILSIQRFLSHYAL